MRDLYAAAAKLARSERTILLTGETGTGKSVLARHIHAQSERRLLVICNAAELPTALVESELFGSRDGAFTGARNRVGLIASANRGTLFLDEIGELPLELQTKLLRVLEDGYVRPIGADHGRHVSVRFLMATNRNLPAAVARGGFRQDLLYRINGSTLHLPPLRDRPDDIAALVAAHLGQRFTLTASARSLLMAHPWPGNIRELEAVLLTATECATTQTLDIDDFRLLPPQPIKPTPAMLKNRLRDLVADAGGLQSAAAAWGVAPATVGRMIA